MNDGLLQLLELQEVDKELQALEDAKEQYPAEIEQRRKQLAAAADSLEQAKAQLAEIEQGQRRHEMDLEAAKADLKEHEARFSTVTNNREYDALQMEVEACRTRIADSETHILEAIDAAQALRQQLEDEQQRFDEEQTEQQGRIDELQEKLDTLQQQVDAVNARREQFAGTMEPPLRRVYERSRKRRGMRVAAVRKGSCGGCFRQLPPQQRNNVRHNREVSYCESCGAILVWDDESS